MDTRQAPCPCPDRDALERFVQGLVSDEEAGPLEEHLEWCPHCLETLHALKGTDPLADRLRRGEAVADRLTPDARVEELMRQLRQMHPGADWARETMTAPPGGDLHPCEGPLPEPGELGRLGPYRLREVLGSGGMGVVFRAEDPQLGRELAVKMLRPDLRHQPDMVRRFLEEAKITAQLPHPGIVPVHELRCDGDSPPFLAMKLIGGRTLQELLDRRGSLQEDLPRFVAVFEQVCQAVAFAHSRRVVHRDLKPANVMVGQFGEVQVMDWGLAKVLTEASGRCQPPATPELTSGGCQAPAPTQGAVGTWCYMPPEQAAGAWERVDERSDAFSLGGILCTILTGRPPYEGDGNKELKRQAVRGELAPARARLDGCGADAELVALAKDCLSPRVEGRPADAGEVTRRVAAYRAGVEQRLRAAERERAAAQARVQEARATARAEAKARRRTRLLAGVVLLALAVGGATAGWYLKARARAGAAVEAALVEADTHLTQNRDDRDRNPERWHAALRLAAAAVDRAQVALNSAALDRDLRHRVERERAQVDRELRDSDLRLLLDQIRLEQAILLKEGRFDNTVAGPRYREVLASYGIDPADAAASAPLVRASRLRGDLVAALADWARVTLDAQERKQLLALLEAAEKDDTGASPWRALWRAALTSKDGVALAALARRHGENLAATDVANLAMGLRELGQLDAAVRLLRRGRVRFPEDFWLNHDLGMALHQRDARSGEGVPYLMVAVALRPLSPGAHVNLGFVLTGKGDMDGALRCFRKALELDPTYAAAHTNLGAALAARGDQDGAIRCYRRAIELDPKLAQAHSNLGSALCARGDVDGAIHCFEKAIGLGPGRTSFHYNLGVALQAKGDLDSAIRCYQKATELDPKNAWAHYNLGNALRARRDQEGAIRSYRKVLELDPKDAKAHTNLGNALQAKGDVDGAIRCFQRAIELDPKLTTAHDNLGNALQAKGDVDGAIRSYRKALDLDPTYAWAHYNLGNVLRDKGDMAGATRCYRRAIELDPRHAEAHCNLGFLLQSQGRFVEALPLLRRGDDLGSRWPGWPYPSAQWVQRAETLAGLDAKLSAVLGDKAPPADAAEAVALAGFCRQHKQLPAAAARLYAEAFAAQPKLADDLQAQHRHAAACCAALAAAGTGQDAGQLDPQARAALRQQALRWLRADLDAWTVRLMTAEAPQRAAILQALQQWQQEGDLAGLRDEKALAALAADERAAWRKLWADVAERIRQARQPR
jgi:tetratricopeptide (TPR) repeat protein